jgi:hypothetical protein
MVRIRNKKPEPNVGTAYARYFALQIDFSTKEKMMSKKHKGGPAPVPKGNQPHAGPEQGVEKDTAPIPHGAPASEQDPKRRLGNYGTAGEHAIEQPDEKKGSDH